MKYHVLIIYCDGTQQEFDCNIIHMHDGKGGYYFFSNGNPTPFGPNQLEEYVDQILITKNQ